MTSQAVMKRYLTSVAKNNEEYKENKTIQYIASLIANYKKLEAKDKEELDAKIEIAYGKLQAKGVSASKSTSKATTTRRTKSSTDGGLKGILADLKKKLGAEKFKDATTGTDIKKDIQIPALKKGKRIVRKKGKTTNQYGTFKNKVGRAYWESRANRYDANQPSQIRKYKLADGGNIDKNIRFDVDFYDDNNTRKENSVELILRGSSLRNVIKDAIKKAYELKKNYIEFYNRNSFLGSINLAISSDFREGRDFREGKIKLADGGEIGNKVYNEMYGVGSSKYLVNFHDGEKTHKDGSPFFDIRIFKNKVEKDKFVKELKSKGFVYKYAEGGEIEVGSIVNLPEIKMKDGRVQYERVVGGEVIGFEDGIYDVLNPKTNRLHRVTKQQIEQIDQAKAKHTRSKASLRSNEDTYPKGTEFAKGGMSEHGLEVGDKIVMDVEKRVGNMPNTIGVEDYDKEFHLVDLDKGERYAKGGKTSEEYAVSGILSENDKIEIISKHKSFASALVKMNKMWDEGKLDKYLEVRVKPISKSMEYAKGGEIEKPLSYYKYETPKVRIAWRGKIQPLGMFKSAEEAYEVIENRSDYPFEREEYSIVTPDKVIHLGKEYQIRMAKGGTTKRIKRKGC